MAAAFCHDALLQCIVLDSDGMLLGRCDGVSQVAVASASKSLRSVFGAWLVSSLPNHIEQLECNGFLHCKLFVQNGGFDIQVMCERVMDGVCSQRPKRIRPLDIIESVGNIQYLSDPFPAFARYAPTFLGAVLCEFFVRLQTAELLNPREVQNDEPIVPGQHLEHSRSERLPKVLQILEARVRDWHAALLVESNQWRSRFANQRFADILCSVPPTEAIKCGLAAWFVRIARKSIVDVASSSTEAFLCLQSDCKSKEGQCIEFLNVLAAVSHCGFVTRSVRLMFESCISTIIAWEDNLVVYAWDTGVTLSEALSVLAKASKNLWSSERGKERLLEQILDAALERDRRALESDGDGFGCAAEQLERILICGRLSFSPMRGYSRAALAQVNTFQNMILDLFCPLAGRSLSSPYGDSAWKPEIVKALLQVETHHYHYGSGLSRQEATARWKIQIEGARKKWVSAYLTGIEEYLSAHVDTIPVVADHSGINDPDSEVLFTDDDAEGVRSLWQEHPFARPALEHFLRSMLAIRL